MTKLAEHFAQMAKKVKRAELEAFGYMTIPVTCECDDEDHVHSN